MRIYNEYALDGGEWGTCILYTSFLYFILFFLSRLSEWWARKKLKKDRYTTIGVIEYLCEIAFVLCVLKSILLKEEREI